MLNPSSSRVHGLRAGALLVLSIGSTAGLAQCAMQAGEPPTITCSDFGVIVPTDGCARISNPCGADWAPPGHGDEFQIVESGRPPSVFVLNEQDADFNKHRSICSAAGGPNITNDPVVFIYQNERGDYGTGHLTITVASPFSVTAEAEPPVIDPGNSSQLVVRVAGGSRPYSYNWLPPSGLTVTNTPIPVATPEATTLYTVSVTDSAGLTRFAEVLVRVNQRLSVTASPATIRAGDTSQLNAIVLGGRLPYTYAWTPADTLNDPTRSNPLATPAHTTTYTVTATDADGVARTTAVTVNVLDVIAEVEASPARLLPGESSQLSALVTGGTPPYSFSWSPNGSLDDPTSLAPVATPSASTQYTLSVTDAHGTPAVATAFVGVGPIVATASANPDHVGRGESSELNVAIRGGVPPYSFAWTSRAGSMDDPTSDHPRAAAPHTTTFDVTVTDATGAFVGAQVVLWVVDFPVTIVASPASVNPGDPVQLTATVGGGTPPYVFTWDGPRIVDRSRGVVAVVLPDVTSRYDLEVEEATGSGFASIVVPVNLRAAPSATPPTINAGETSQLLAGAAGGSPPYSCSWSPSTGLSSATSCRPIASPASTTAYVVTVTDSAGSSVVGQTAVAVNGSSAPPFPLAAAFTFTRDDSVTPPLLIFDGSSSTGAVVSYTWDLTARDGTVVHRVTTDPIVRIEVAQEGMNRGTMALTVAAADGRTTAFAAAYR